MRVITIDRPDAKNALDSAMRTTFIDLIADADVDAEVHAVVITATDPVFSAGVDFKESMQPSPGDGARGATPGRLGAAPRSGGGAAGRRSHRRSAR